MSSEQTTELAKVEGAIASMNRLDAGLEDLRKRFGKVIYDVTTPKGMTEAKCARREVAAPRIEVEKIRKEAKAPILELGRKLDAAAKRITEELLSIETPIDEQIKREENRIDAERQEKIRREEQRQADIQGRIQDFRNAVNGALRARTSAEVTRILADVSAVVVDQGLFAEHTVEAGKVKAESATEIERIRNEAIAREQEAQVLAEERAQFERQRAEQADRDRKAQEIQGRLSELRGNQNLTAASGSELIAEHLNDLENLPTDAEIFGEFVQQACDAKAAGLARLEGLLKSAQEFEAEQARQRIEQARITREREDLERQQREAREQQEARDRAAQEAAAAAEREAEATRQRNYRPTTAEMVAVLCDHYDRDAATVDGWLREAFATSEAA